MSSCKAVISCIYKMACRLFWLVGYTASSSSVLFMHINYYFVVHKMLHGHLFTYTLVFIPEASRCYKVYKKYLTVNGLIINEYIVCLADSWYNDNSIITLAM